MWETVKMLLHIASLLTAEEKNIILYLRQTLNALLIGFMPFSLTIIDEEIIF